VDDVAASTRAAKVLAAKVMMDKTEIGDEGWMSVIVDPRRLRPPSNRTSCPRHPEAWRERGRMRSFGA